MTVTIHLPDEKAAALQAQADARGLSLEKWIARLADEEANAYEEPLTAQASEDRRLLVTEAIKMMHEIRKNSKPDPDGWTIRDYIDFGRR